MSTWVCVTCNLNCEREDESEDPLDFPLQGVYCPYIDDYTEWEVDE